MGHVPLSWVSFVNMHVDYVWTLSEYNAQMFLTKKSIPEERVKVLPLGTSCITPGTFNQSVTSNEAVSKLREIPNEKTVFLYVGGALPRKSIDVIVRAWCEAFNKEHNVVLVIKLTYEHGGQDSIEAIKETQENPNCPKVILISGYVPDISIFYERASVLIHPARAEGFGLTPLEALAHSLVVVYNEVGATAEFLSDEYAVSVVSHKETCINWPCKDDTFCVFQDTERGSWDMCERLEDYPFWHTPDQLDLSKKLKMVWKNLAAFQTRAKVGTRFICEHFSWDAVSEVARKHLLQAVKDRCNQVSSVPSNEQIPPAWITDGWTTYTSPEFSFLTTEQE